MQIIIASNYNTFPDGRNSSLSVSVESGRPSDPILIVAKDLAADPKQLSQAIQQAKEYLERNGIE